MHASHHTTPSPARVDQDERDGGGELAAEVLREAAAAGVGEAAVARDPVGRPARALQRTAVTAARRGDRRCRTACRARRRARSRARRGRGGGGPSALAKCPPRLCPISASWRPDSPAIPLRAGLERVERAVRAADVPGDPERCGAWPYPVPASSPSPSSMRSPARKPGISNQPARRRRAARPAPRTAGSIISRSELGLPAQLGGVAPPPVSRRIGCRREGAGGVEGMRHPRVPTS